MSNLAQNRIIPEEVHSPYHPSNIVRLKHINHQVAQCDYGAKPDIIVTHDIEKLANDWKRIEHEPHISVHQSYNWCKAWIEHKGIKPLFIALKYGRRIEFILPLEIKQAFGLKVAQFIGTEHSNVNFVLASRALLINVPSNFVNHVEAELKSRQLGVDVILLERMRLQLFDMDNPFAIKLTTRNQNSSFQLPLLPSFEETLAQLNAKRRRKKFRNTERKLKAIGDYKYKIAHSAAEQEQALASFFEQKAKRFANLGIPDVFADLKTQAVLVQLSKLRSNQVGHLELHTLLRSSEAEAPEGEKASDIIAIAAMTNKNGHTICHFSSFDEGFAERTETSPGEFLFHLAIENAVEKGRHVFDFGIGDQKYKHSWCTVQTEHYDGYIAQNGLGCAFAEILQLKTVLLKHIKQSETLFKVASRIRSVLARA